MEETYAQALKNAIASGTDETKAVSNLVANLKANGRTKAQPQFEAFAGMPFGASIANHSRS